jgi:hypothetical protein
MDAVMEFVGADVVSHDQTSIRLFERKVKDCVDLAVHNVTAYARRRKSFAGVECVA